MQFRSKLFQRGAAAGETTLTKIYDVYITPEGHFAAREQEGAARNANPPNAIDGKKDGE